MSYSSCNTLDFSYLNKNSSLSNNCNTLSGYYQNVRGLKSKLSNIRLNFVSLNHYDYFILTETWLTSDINSNELGMFNFTIFRNDRNNLNSVHSKGGGVLIAVHNRFCPNALTLSNPLLESIAVSFKSVNSKIILLSIYIPPNSSIDVYKSHCVEIENLRLTYPDCTFIIAGDFNLPDINWSNINHAILSGPSSDKSKVLAETIAFEQFFQHNFIKNYKNNILDLVISDKNSLDVTKCSFPLVSIDIAHPPLQINGPIVVTTLRSTIPSLEFNFRRANYEAMNVHLNSIVWESVLCDSLDFSVIIHNFYTVIQNAINMFTPKVAKNKTHYPQWYSSELKSLLYNKKRLHKEFKITKDYNIYNEFSRLRALCKKESKTSYLRYINKIQLDLTSDPKSFWRYVKCLKVDSDIPHSMVLNAKTSTGGSGVADLFKEFFSSVYSTESLNIDKCIEKSKDYIDICQQPLINFTVSEIFNALHSLDFNPCPGPDGIPNILLRSCKYSLSIPLCRLFNRSLKVGVFPPQWKNSFITPIFKSGNKSCITNYRPITKQSALPKLIEKLIVPSLAFSFKNIIDNNQHGFRKGRSVETNLLCFYNFLVSSMESGKQTDVIYTDFSKAFDSVNHSMLIAKLRLYGISDPLITWLHSYLTDRSQQVKVNGSLSDTIQVPSGVPQGGHLSPLLFVIFILDIGNCFKYCRYQLFADDLKIYANILSPIDHCKIQDDLNRFSEWCRLNGLKLNTSKCFKMSFSRSKNMLNKVYHLLGDNIEEISSVRDLGVVFQTNLLFSSHIDYICSKALRVLGFINRNTKGFKNELCLTTLFTSLVRPILEYCSVLWNPSQTGLVEMIERVQRRFLRLIAYKRNINFNINQIELTSISSIQTSLKLDSLVNRRRYFDICFVSKLVNGLISCPELLQSLYFHVPQYNPRYCPTFVIPFHRTSYGSNNPIDRIARECNGLKNFDIFNFSDLYSTKKILLASI
jgi:hypothetical protein